MSHTTNLDRIAIIGGGPGGLMTAYLLEKQWGTEVPITVFEATRRLGGKVRTARFDERPARFEAGAAELYDYSHLGEDPLRELVAELGLTTQPLEGGAAILHDRVVPNAEALAHLWGPATYSAWRKFYQKAKRTFSPGDYYESDWRPKAAEPASAVAFHELLEGVSDPIARDYIRVMVHSDLACEPHHTSAAYGLQNHLMDDTDYLRLYSICGGNEQLVSRLASRVRANKRLNQPVVRVARAPQGYGLTSRRGGSLVTENFSHVIVALPVNGLGAIAWEGPALKRAMERHQAKYDHPAHYLRVTLQFERPFWRGSLPGAYFMCDAFGGCCVYDESSRLPADAGGGVLSWLLAGNAAVALANLSDADVVQQVLAALPAPLKMGRKLFCDAQVHRWLNAVNARPGGVRPENPQKRHQPDAAGCPDFFVVGDYLFDSTLNGVLDSAGAVVELIVEDRTNQERRCVLTT